MQLYQVLKRQVDQQFPRAKQQARQLRCAKGLIDLLALDALDETDRRLNESKPQRVEEVRRASGKMVDLSERGRRQLSELEDFLMENVYQHEQVMEAQKKAAEEMRFLFQAYLKEPSLLPGGYQERLKDYETHRVICDYIAGMTDRYCRRQYEERRGK